MRGILAKKVRRLVADESGNFGILTALVLVPLFAVTSIALNLSKATEQSGRMQAALDATAIAAVKSYGEGEGQAKAIERANAVFLANFGRSSTVEAPAAAGAAADGSTKLVVAFSKINDDPAATASYSLQYDPIFWGLSPYTIARNSVAARIPGIEACILALHPTASRAIEVGGSAVVDTSNCTITSNSRDTQSIYLGGSAKLKAECLYAVGKISATLANLELACGRGQEDAAPTPDPFKYKKMPTAGSWVSLAGCGTGFVGGGGGNGDCNGTGKTPNKVADSYAVTLKPGTYRDLEIKGKVSLQPGNYIIDGGTMKFASQSVVTGEGVTFFLLNGAELDLHGGSTFKITPATTGEWAGFSIVADRNNTARAVINGNTNSSLTGIIYMPASKEIQFSGNGKTGGECVRIVAQEITMIGNAGFKLDCKTELANNTINNPGAIRLVK